MPRSPSRECCLSNWRNYWQPRRQPEPVSDSLSRRSVSTLSYHTHVVHVARNNEGSTFFMTIVIYNYVCIYYVIDWSNSLHKDTGGAQRDPQHIRIWCSTQRDRQKTQTGTGKYEIRAWEVTRRQIMYISIVLCLPFTHTYYIFQLWHAPTPFFPLCRNVNWLKRKGLDRSERRTTSLPS